MSQRKINFGELKNSRCRKRCIQDIVSLKLAMKLDRSWKD